MRYKVEWERKGIEKQTWRYCTENNLDAILELVARALKWKDTTKFLIEEEAE